MFRNDTFNAKEYNRKETLDIINSEIYTKKNFLESIVKNADKKTIEILKDKVFDLVKNLQEAFGKSYESEFRLQRAEIQREAYEEKFNKKIAENNAILESIEPLKNQISNLTQALSTSKMEIERLNFDNKSMYNELNAKKEEIEKLKNEYDRFFQKNYELKNDNDKLRQKINELNERIEIMQLSLDRYQSKQQEKKEFYTPIKNSTTNNQAGLAVAEKLKEQHSEEMLKLQLQIVDLKKRLSEDDKIKQNLFEVIKAKKIKIENLKSEINNKVSIFEENGKENKWSQDLILQKDIIIKVLKDKINSIMLELKNKNKKLVKYLYKQPTEEKSVEANIPFKKEEDVFVQVKAFPFVFKNQNKNF